MGESKEKKTKRKKQTINGQPYIVINVKVRPYLDKNGNRKVYKKFYGKTLKECYAKRDKFNANHVINAREMFFGELADDFICNTFLPDPNFKESTKQRYIDAYNNNLAPMDITKKLITDVDYRGLQAAYNDMTCAPSGVKNCHKLMRLFFKLMEQEDICKDITKSLVVPKPKKKNAPGEIIVFNDEEIEAIKKYIARKDLPYYENRRVCRLRFLITLAINTGARISELLALTYDDIQPDKITINKQVVEKPIFEDGKTVGHELVIDDTKTENSVRSIPITEETYSRLAEHIEWQKEDMKKNKYDTDLLFTTDSGKLYDKHSLRHTLDRIHEDAKVSQYGFHAYRHTFGTKLASKGVALQTLSSLMGHSDISVTAKYYINVPAAEKIEAIKALSA